MRPATPIELSPEERRTLETWVRASTTEQRLVLRAQLILAAAAGTTTTAIAHRFRVRPATVSQWRRRFAAQRLVGLQDRPRPGPRRRYGAEVERRILTRLDQPPPAGYASWSGRRLARALGDVSARQVWRVLARHRISLQRRHSWCISTDPQFAAQAADLVGIYLAPPDHAVVLCVDEKPSIQAPERAQGYLRLPNGQALKGFNHEYERHGTTTLFAALSVSTGQVKAGHYARRRRREFLDFMNEVVADYSHREIHVVLDNLSSHKPKRDRWLARHPNVHVHYTPTHASWLNQIEIWFSILTRQALRGVSFTSPRQVREAIDRFLAAYNAQAAPFEWRKREVRSVGLKQHYGQLRH
ncbi:MAG TPA: IS630 family transposase [Terriglobia bacterium]|nr:IS630 family transposase [Terriglobia bacterium]